jgi:hypothetical protein
VRGPHDNEVEREGGRAAERLREFLAKRLPPGVSVDETHEEISEETEEHPGRQDEDGSCPAQNAALTNNRNSGDFGRQA